MKLHPLDLLLKMSPLSMAQCVVFALWAGEVDKVWGYDWNTVALAGIGGNGVVAFGEWMKWQLDTEDCPQY